MEGRASTKGAGEPRAVGWLRTGCRAAVGLLVGALAVLAWHAVAPAGARWMTFEQVVGLSMLACALVLLALLAWGLQDSVRTGAAKAAQAREER